MCGARTRIESECVYLTVCPWENEDEEEKEKCSAPFPNWVDRRHGGRAL